MFVPAVKEESLWFAQVSSELSIDLSLDLSTLRCVPCGSSARLEAEQIATPFT
jgi:hypothetical protein